MKKLTIHLDSPTNTYYSGQDVEGNISWVSDKEKKFIGLRVRFFGVADVTWHKRNPSFKFTWFKYLDDNELITNTQDSYLFDYNLNIFGNNNETERIIPPGVQTCPFKFSLPKNLPSSFKNNIASIKYEIHADMRSKSGSDYSANAILRVISILDLNLFPELLTPLFIQKDLTFSSIWNKGGPISYKLIIPKRGFTPGQFISVTLQLNNNTGKNANIEFNLIQTRIFRAETQVRTIEKSMKKWTGLEGKYNEIWNLRVPEADPSGLGFCRIIDIQYNLQMKIKFSGMVGSSIKQAIPITIGSIPFRGVQESNIPSIPSTITNLPYTSRNLPLNRANIQEIHQNTRNTSMDIARAAREQEIIPDHISRIIRPPPSYEETFGLPPSTESIFQNMFLEQNS